MKKKLKKIPRFRTEAAERRFWNRVDSTEYVDYSMTQNWRFPNLKLSSKPITIRLPQGVIDRFKIRAHKMDIPYQTLIKQTLIKSLSRV